MSFLSSSSTPDAFIAWFKGRPNVKETLRIFLEKQGCAVYEDMAQWVADRLPSHCEPLWSVVKGKTQKLKRLLLRKADLSRIIEEQKEGGCIIPKMELFRKSPGSDRWLLCGSGEVEDLLYGDAQHVTMHLVVSPVSTLRTAARSKQLAAAGFKKEASLRSAAAKRIGLAVFDREKAAVRWLPQLTDTRFLSHLQAIAAGNSVTECFVYCYSGCESLADGSGDDGALKREVAAVSELANACAAALSRNGGVSVLIRHSRVAAATHSTATDGDIDMEAASRRPRVESKKRKYMPLPHVGVDTDELIQNVTTVIAKSEVESAQKSEPLFDAKAPMDDAMMSRIQLEASDFKDNYLSDGVDDSKASVCQYPTELKPKLSAFNGLYALNECLKHSKDCSVTSLHLLKPASVLSLDRSSLSALNVFPRVSDSSPKASVFGLLNRCRSKAGGELLADWLRQPLTSAKLATERQSVLEFFVKAESAREQLFGDLLKAVPNFERIVRQWKAAFAKLARFKQWEEDAVSDELLTVAEERASQSAIEACMALWRFVDMSLPTIVECLGNCKPDFEAMDDAKVAAEGCDDSDDVQLRVKALFFEPLAQCCAKFEMYKQFCEVVLDFEEATARKYRVRSDYDAKLQQYNAKMEKAKVRMQEMVDAIKAKCRVDKMQLRLKKVEGGAQKFLIRIPSSQWKTKMKKKLSAEGLAVNSQTKAEVSLSSPLLEKLNARYANLRSLYLVRTAHLVHKMTEIALSYKPMIAQMAAALAHLDLCVSLAHVCEYYHWTRPQMLEMDDCNARIELKSARHPSLDALMRDGEFGASDGCVANDFCLRKGESGFQLITGPNMGGKSTALRTVASVCLLAQTGCLIPAKSGSVVTCVDAILARVGAADNESQGVSTFMAEMVDCRSILDTATGHSLVIVDELGRGTSTYDGYGIAYAICKHLQEKGCFALFATHFHELCQLAEDSEGVVNRQVLVDTRTEALRMTYQLADGYCSHSFGIRVAELAGFHPSIIECAKRKVKMLEAKSQPSGLSKASFQFLSQLLADFKAAKITREELRQRIAEKCPQSEDLRKYVKRLLADA